MMARRVLLGVPVGLLLCGGAVAALPLVADELPKPLAEVARVPERLWTRVFAPRVNQDARLAGLTEPEQESVRALARRLAGRVVWASNRSGNHELYVLDLEDRSVRRLTDHPNVDFFSRWSPDGRQIVFLRSQREWVSFRDPDAWDVYVLNADGSGEQRIARGGYHPTWTADGSAVVFHRGPQVFRYDLATREERVIFHAETEISKAAQIGDVELGPDNRRLTFGIRGPFSGAAVFDLQERTLVPLTKTQACQPTWAPDGKSLAWVELEGHGGTRVMTGRPDGSERRVLMDLPGAHSHEYFPKLSNDGRWLIWGAAAKGHEHDRADYEIFLWKVGSPWGSAVRLTHHPGNDQWPDLYLPRSP